MRCTCIGLYHFDVKKGSFLTKQVCTIFLRIYSLCALDSKTYSSSLYMIKSFSTISSKMATNCTL